jgi:HrpA-like RNA helicase
MDPTLQAYTLVIVDEAHERRVDTDLLFGAMKLCLNRRPDLKVSHILIFDLVR